MKTTFKEYLFEKNIQITGEEENTLSFTIYGLNYVFITDSDDICYFRLILPNIKIFDEQNMSEYAEMANEYSQKYKVVKMIDVDRSVWLVVEQFVFSTENINYLFDKCINILRFTIEQFRISQNKTDL